MWLFAMECLVDYLTEPILLSSRTKNDIFHSLISVRFLLHLNQNPTSEHHIYVYRKIMIAFKELSQVQHISYNKPSKCIIK